jgi:hypothetical protein
MYPVLDTFLKISLPRLMLFNSYLILNFLHSTNPNHKVILISPKVKNKKGKEGVLLAKKEINKKVEKIELTTKKMMTITTITMVVDFWNQSSRTSQVS